MIGYGAENLGAALDHDAGDAGPAHLSSVVSGTARDTAVGISARPKAPLVGLLIMRSFWAAPGLFLGSHRSGNVPPHHAMVPKLPRAEGAEARVESGASPARSRRKFLHGSRRALFCAAAKNGIIA